MMASVNDKAEFLRRANAKREEARAKKKKHGFKGPEKVLQSNCEEYLKRLGLRYIHIPDQLLHYLRMKSPVQIAKLSSMAFKGVPDLLIFYRDKCLLIELKSYSGRLSQGQIDWQKNVDVHLVRDFETFRKLVDELIKD